MNDKPKLTEIPATLACVEDYRALVPEFVAPEVWAYIEGGSGDEITLRRNREAFDQFAIVPRVLVDCRQGSAATQWLGQPLRHPIGLAPVGYQRLVHPDGELATAQAADALDSLMVTSTMASVSLEAQANLLSGPKWFQLYFQPQPEQTLELIQRAEAAGYDAIVVTLDTPVQMQSRQANRLGFQHSGRVRPVNLESFSPPVKKTLHPSDSAIFQGLMQQAPTWDHIQWLLAHTQLPIIAKGVMHPDDAQPLVDSGVQGIIVSNHGGRALDGAPAALLQVNCIRERLGSEPLLLMDGGVRTGVDAFKAIALGADGVLLGRPQLYGLAVAGALGVAHLLRLLRDELEYCMALTGCTSIADIRQCSVQQI